MSENIKTKYLSVFTDRFIPDWFKNRYPKYKKFIQYFLEYLEDDGNVYDDLANIIDFIDIDAISSETDLDRRQNLIDQVYAQFVGDPNAQYLSTLMDEILFIKYHKGLVATKGLKSNFLFFFLFILGGYFRIVNADITNKRHNGIFSYNGAITYNTIEGFSEAFTYIVKSDLNPGDYQKILDVLNPAGMFPITFLEREMTVEENVFTIENIYFKPDIYVALYNNGSLLGIVKAVLVQPYNQTFPADPFYDTYDFQMQNGTRWNEFTIETGYLSDPDDAIFYKAILNTSILQGDFDSIDIISAPTVSTPGEYSYESGDVISVGEILYSVYVGDGTGDSFTIVDNTSLGLMVKF